MSILVIALLTTLADQNKEQTSAHRGRRLVGGIQPLTRREKSTIKEISALEKTTYFCF